MLTREQIFEALEIVHKECKARWLCDGCKFYRGFDRNGNRICGISEYPAEWKLEDKEEQK